VLTTAEAVCFRQSCEKLELQLGGKPRTVEVRQMHLHFPWASELATHPQVLNAVESILGPNLLVWATELFIKHPHDVTVSIRWHRDRTYMGFEPDTTTTAWIALSNSNRLNGCMCVVPKKSVECGMLSAECGVRSAESQSGVSEDEIVEVTLTPGEMSLHDAEILHGSSPNRSDEKRVGFVIRYITPEARPPQGRPPVLLARGVDGGNHFTIVEPPGETGDDEALTGMKESAVLHLDAMLETIKNSDVRASETTHIRGE
jgi:hypothetical protein